MEILSSEYINQLIYNYKSVEVNRRLKTIQTKKNNFSTLGSTLTDVNTKVTKLISSLSALKTTGSTSTFNSKSASSSNDSLVTAAAENSANVGSFNIFVNQLAKSDVILSETKSSDSASGIAAGTNIIQINSGDYNSSVELETDGTETYEELMDALSQAINTDYATVTSSGSGSYTNSGSFVMDVGGSETTINYDYSSGATYSEIVDNLVSQINTNVDGVTAENDNGNLKITVTNKDDYISISDDSGTLISDLGLSTTKQKAASALSTASYFAQSSDNSKFSLSADENGYSNRLIVSDVSGSVLDTIGLTAAVLADRTTKAADDLSAGYAYLANSSTNNELNSKIKFNGINIQRDTNTIDNLVSGVTFNLKSTMIAGTDPDVNITIENNNEKIRTEVQDFIDRFNELYTLLKDKTKSTENSRGILRGEATISSLLNSLRSIGYSTFGDSGNEFQYLSQLGISFDSTSGLSISNSDLFDENINNHSEDVANFFNSDNGLATTFYESLNNYTGSSGYITLAKQSYESNVEYLSDRIDSVSASIDKSAELMRKKYQAMQSQYAALLSSQSFFSNGSY